MKSKFEKWIKWCKSIENDIRSLLNDAAYYSAYMEMVHANLDNIQNNNGIAFVAFIRMGFVHRAFMGIRRQLGKLDDEKSLMNLLKEIKESAPDITFDVYSSVHKRELKGGPVDPHSHFSLMSEDSETVSFEKVHSDVCELENMCHKIVQLANKRIAHLTTKSVQDDIQPREFEEALSAINKIGCKYINFVNGGNLIDLCPSEPHGRYNVIKASLVSIL